MEVKKKNGVEKGEKEGWIFKSTLVTRPSRVMGILPKSASSGVGEQVVLRSYRSKNARERYRIGLGREIEEQKGTGGHDDDRRRTGGAANRLYYYRVQSNITECGPVCFCQFQIHGTARYLS